MTISACMIVRDAEETIVECLTKLKPGVDELILVDTGSVDKTLELVVKTWGADKPITILHREWNDDFSAARNFSIEQASGDWVFIIDSDEFVVEDDWAPLLHILSQKEAEKYGSVIVDLLNVRMDTRNCYSRISQVRFFRKGFAHYAGEVHNQLVFDKPIAFIRLPFKIHHVGYNFSPEKMAAKLERITRMTEKAYKERPDSCFTCYNYCMAMKGHGVPYMKEHFEEMRDILRHGIECAQVDPKFKLIELQATSLLAWVCYYTDRWEDGVEWAHRALRLKKDFLDAILVMAFCYANLQKIPDAEYWCMEYIHEYNAHQREHKWDEMLAAQEMAEEKITVYKTLIAIENYKQIHGIESEVL